jgi:hypothetical protein
MSAENIPRSVTRLDDTLQEFEFHKVVNTCAAEMSGNEKSGF